jgi:hypothetical protein
VHKDLAVQRAAVWVQAVIALVVLLCAWRLHVKVLPYEWGYQNKVESWLFGANLVLVLLAIIYTALGYAGAFAHSGTRAGVETLMVIVLVGALVFAVVILVRAYRNGAKRQREMAAERALNLGAGLTGAARRFSRLRGFSSAAHRPSRASLAQNRLSLVHRSSLAASDGARGSGCQTVLEAGHDEGGQLELASAGDSLFRRAKVVALNEAEPGRDVRRPSVPVARMSNARKARKSRAVTLPTSPPPCTAVVGMPDSTLQAAV